MAREYCIARTLRTWLSVALWTGVLENDRKNGIAIAVVAGISGRFRDGAISDLIKDATILFVGWVGFPIEWKTF